MSIDSEIGGPSAEDRQLVYARMGMSNHAIRHAENMVYGSPSRKVGKGALTNVVTRFDSLKNRKPRVLESHTCELVCAYELELDPGVIGYHAQVPCRGIRRVLPNGRRHVASANLDFLVFRQDAVELIECKPKTWLLTNAELHSDWTQCDGIWEHKPYRAFASEHEVGFSVWSPPHEPGIYLQNLEAIYGVMRGGMDTIASRAVDQAIAAIAKQPVSVSQLCEHIDGFSVRTALWMLGKWLAFGPLKSTPILMADRFHLYIDRQHAKAVDALAQQESGAIYCQSELTDPLLRASTSGWRALRLLREVRSLKQSA
jgi:putative transposase